MLKKQLFSSAAHLFMNVIFRKQGESSAVQVFFYLWRTGEAEQVMKHRKAYLLNGGELNQCQPANCSSRLR